MISLGKHIEILLLEHDCVIVPGLGAFIANHASACYNENGDNMFLPPYRNICFNQSLATNDGLLVQAYMSAYDAAYPEAQKQMTQDINDTLYELDVNGFVKIKGIGVLSKNLSGNITFEPEEVGAGILTPSLYGMYSFGIKSWEEALKERDIKEALKDTLVLPIRTNDVLAETDEPVKEHKAKSNNKTRFIDIAVAAVASVLLFFLFSYPALKSFPDSTSNTYVASSIKISNKKKESLKEPNHNPTEFVAKIKENKEPEENINIVSAPLKVESIITENKFVIVLATCVTEKNANILIEKLKKEGYSDVVFNKNGKMNRVTYSSFSTFKEANDELSTLRNLSPYFKEAWVYNTNK